MQFEKHDYILGVWYVGDNSGNITLAVKKYGNENSWIVENRMRQYTSGKIFDSDDLKRTSSHIVKDVTESEMKQRMAKLAETIARDYNYVERHHLDVCGSPMKMIEMAKQTTWMHTKIEPVH